MTTLPLAPDPKLYNDDLAPIPHDRRPWNWLNLATIWMGMVHNIVVYEAAAGLMALGFSAVECLEVVAVAYAVLFIAMCLNAVSGTRYGLPFCVLIRSAFGPVGAQLPVLLRGFCAIFWFSVQAYAASQAVDAIMMTVWPAWQTLSITWLGMTMHGWCALALIWALHGWIMNHGIQSIGRFELVAGPLVIIMGAGAALWGLSVGHGIGPLFALPSHLHGWAFAGTFAGGVTGIMGMWASFAVNVPDLSRFVRSQRDQIIGQFIGLPVTALIFTPMAIVTTSATVIVFGHAIWNPVDLLLALNNTTVTLLGGATIVIATLSVNVVANIMPACYDLINLMPRRLDFHRSAYLVLILGLAFMPWLWFTQATSVFALLNIISGLLGPVTGVMLADYFVRRRQLLSLPDLYRRDGLYEGLYGWGVAAILAFIIGGFLAVIGAFVPTLALLNKLSWFVGCGVSFTLYLVFSQSGSIDKRRLLPNVPRVRHEQGEYVTE